jgi:1,4-alpha-glucan branching enzyme
VVAVEIPSHGYVASANVTVPPLGAVWLRFESVADEEQEEPEKVEAGVRAAARRVSPTRTAAEVEASKAGDLRAARQSRPAGGEKPPAGSGKAEAEEAEEEPRSWHRRSRGRIHPAISVGAPAAVPPKTAEVADES